MSFQWPPPTGPQYEPVTAEERATVLAAFYAGLPHNGFAVSFAWPDKVRRIVGGGGVAPEFSPEGFLFDSRLDALEAPGSVTRARLAPAVVAELDAVTGAYVPNGPDVPVNTGGTGASTAAVARTNLGAAAASDLARVTSRVFDVRDYGTVGTANDAPAFQAAINAAVAAGGGTVIAPDSTYTIGATLNLSSHVHIAGNGGRIVAPAGVSFPIFDIDAKVNVSIFGIRIVKASGAAATGAGYGVRIRGNAEDITIEQVIADAFVRGVQVAGQEGTIPGTCKRITLLNVTANNSPTNFGINIDDADGVTIDTCYGRGNWLDGLKLRKKTKNVTIIGGAFTGNGVYGAGDGADCYAGGDTFTIMGTEFSGNTGNGLTVKTGDLQQTNSAGYGYVRNVLIDNIRCIGNTAIGCYLTVSAPLDLTQPLVSAISVIGGLYEGNGTGANGDGLYVSARNVTVTNAISRKNRRHGFLATSRAIDTIFTGCIAIANSQAAAGSYNGFDISGNGGSLVNCLAIGADADAVAVAGDYTALTKYHKQGVYINSTATGVWTVRSTRSIYHSGSGSGLWTDLATGICVIDQERAGAPATVGAYGSIGSRIVNTSAVNAEDVVWHKTSGAPNAALTGWTRVPAVATAKPTITGSRGGNAAVADLLTKLAAAGYITDGSSA